MEHEWRTTVAIIGDFDTTLIPGYMRDPLFRRFGNTVEACSILTTTANAVASAVHDRMPVIRDPDWLDPGMKDGCGLRTVEALRCSADAMLSGEHSDRINHVANDGEECSAPVELAQIQARLFS